MNTTKEEIIKLLSEQYDNILARQQDCHPEFIEIVNKEFWNLI